MNMDADFRNFIRTAQGEEPPIAIADPRWAETEALARRLISVTQAEPALRALKPEPQAKKRWDLLLLSGLLQSALGERGASLESLEIVGDKLTAAGDREGVRAMLPRFLEPEPVSAAVRYLHFLARTAPEETERIDLLRQALDIRHNDPQLLSELSLALERTGETEEARELRLDALELWLTLDNTAVVADELLRVVEEDLPLEPGRAGKVLLRFAGAVPWEDSEPILDLALPELERAGAGHWAWRDIEPLAARAPQTPRARTLLAALLRIAVAAEPDPGAIVAGSGILNPGESIADVRARLPKILSLPPGSDVQHATWGLGRAVANDGESVSLEFPGRAGHKMSLAMATRSLDRLPPDGLRVLAARDPERLRALIEARDPQILFSALRDLGGTATLAQAKPRIEAVLAPGEWSAWWKGTKENLKHDARLDLSDAYRQMFTITSAEKRPEITLPELSPRAGEAGLAVIRKFLREHPEQEARLASHAARVTARWAEDTNLDAVVRAQALCHAVSWQAISFPAGRDLLDKLIEAGLSPGDLTLSSQQDSLLDLAQGSREEEQFLWRAMESRLPRLRDRSRARLREVLGPAYGRAVLNQLQRAADGPALAARLLEHYASNPEEEDAPPTGTLLIATLRLLERDGAGIPGIADRLVEMLEEGGTLRRLIEARPLDDDTVQTMESAVLHWRGSERRLNPVLDFLRGSGHAQVAEAHEAQRSATAKTLLAGKSTEDLETRHTIMSRPTYEKLEAEFKRIKLELKTSIPAAIEKARQLGDLRENAEYEAAKQRQANAAARAQELMNVLERTRLLETIEVDASRVGVGTEVSLDPLDQPGSPQLRYWILGEGDNALGPGILSYRAPILKPLLGKQEGDQVVIEFPEGSRPFRIVTIRKRLPGEAAEDNARVDRVI
ncbi:MAG TPA: GreA/GreB family elongation factor [Candidatus Limnocylindrales bacterium]|nr:GreA/GreB family elongation factor [Candidatus Limnocylindrales bacterium]